MLLVTVLVLWGLWNDVKFASLNGLSMREIFWMVLMPIVVVTIYLSPSLWRNVCPLSTTSLWRFNLFGRRKLARLGLVANQRTGLVGKAYDFLRKKGMLVSALLFWTIVPLRLVYFNGSTEMTFWLIVGVFALAALMGVFFPVKSGWCTSICPISAVEKTYGLNPAFHVPNTRCHFYNQEQKRVLSCSGCSLNCTDVMDPEHAYWQATSNKVFHNTVNAEMRKIFLATLPAFLLVFYLVANKIILLPQGSNGAKAAFVYSLTAIVMLAAYALYAGIKKRLYNRAERQSGSLNIEQPNPLYSLYKHRLDLVFVAVTMNIIWVFSAYALVEKVFGRVFSLSGEAKISLLFFLVLAFLALSLFSVRDGWKEDFRLGHHKPHWW
jgi:hypothetical protein